MSLLYPGLIEGNCSPAVYCKNGKHVPLKDLIFNLLEMMGGISLELEEEVYFIRRLVFRKPSNLNYRHELREFTSVKINHNTSMLNDRARITLT